MKMKRWIGILLTLTFCLGLFPNAVFAEGAESAAEEEQFDLPEGYEQMYVESNDSYVTLAEGTAGSGGDVWLYSDTNGTVLNEIITNAEGKPVEYKSYNITCDAVLGEMGLGRNGTNWRKGSAKPGAEGYIYAEPISGTGTKYAIKAKINGNPEVIYDDKGNSEFTVDAGLEQAFTFPPTIYVNGESKRLVAADYNGADYTFACDAAIGTLFWQTGYDELAINTTNATPGATGTITITDKTSDAVYACTVTIKAAASGDGEDDDDDTQGGLPEEQFDLPEGYVQMYVKDGDSYVTIAEGTAGLGGDIWLYSDTNGTVLNEIITNGEGKPVEYKSYNITCDAVLGEMGLGRNGTNWRKGSAKPGAEGYIYAEPISGTGTKYAIKAKINGNPEVIYDDKGNSEFTVDAGLEQAFTFPPTIYVNGESKRLVAADYNGADYTFACDAAIGTLFWQTGYDELAINTTNATPGATGTITITDKTSDAVYACTVTIKAAASGDGEDDDDDNGTQGNGIEYTLKTSSRDIAESEKITESAAEAMEVGPAEFKYDTDGDGTAETYYICAMGGAAEGEYHMAISGGSGNPDGKFWSDFSIGIWTYNPDGNTYTLVSDSIRETLLTAFGDSWSFALYNTTSSENTSYSKTYPAVYSWTDSNGWPMGVAFQYIEPGYWYYAFSGTINGKTVTSYTRSSFKLTKEITYQAQSIVDVNAKLQEWEAIEKAEGYPRKNFYTITLPEGRFVGNITVPEGFYWINLVGQGEDKTTLVGSINTGSTLQVQALTMEGCGWYNTVQSDGVTPNYGIYGTGSARYGFCTFRNYYHALHATGGLAFGGEFGTFENNLIALYLNSPSNGGGATSMEDCIYRDNGCALWLQDFGNDFPLNSYHVLRCEFYGNGWDVINLLGKCYFLPGQFFKHGNDNYSYGKFAGKKEALRDIPASNRPEKASGIAADVSQDDSGVYTFPVAKDNTFGTFDYSNKDVVIGNHNAAGWKIPETDLDGKTITVIQDDKGEDAVVWSFGK